MKMLRPFLLIALVFLLFSNRGEAGDGAEVFQLRYIRSLDTFELMKEVDPEFAEAVVEIGIRDNFIALNPSHPKLDQIRELLVQVDRKPTQKKVTAVISEIDPDSKSSGEKVLARPTVYTTEGKPAVFFYPLENGKTLQFSVTSKEVP